METTLNKNVEMYKSFDLEKYPLIEITRVFDASIERVFQAFSNPELMMQWWGPEDFTCPSAKIDFRVGGKTILAMRDSSGKVIYSSGIYKEIEKNKKIVTTDYFSDESGNLITAKDVGMEGDWPNEQLITIEFSKTDSGKTKMALIHEGMPKEVHDDCVRGWNSSFNKLQRLLERH